MKGYRDALCSVERHYQNFNFFATAGQSIPAIQRRSVRSCTLSSSDAARRLIPLCCIDRLEPDEQSDQLRWRDTGIVAAAAKRPVTFQALAEEMSIILLSGAFKCCPNP